MERGSKNTTSPIISPTNNPMTRSTFLKSVFDIYIKYFCWEHSPAIEYYIKCLEGFLGIYVNHI